MQRSEHALAEKRGKTPQGSHVTDDYITHDDIAKTNRKKDKHSRYTRTHTFPTRGPVPEAFLLAHARPVIHLSRRRALIAARTVPQMSW